MSVYQAIVIVEGQSPMDLVKLSVRAGMEIMNQFDPTRTQYSGKAEHELFKKDFSEWVAGGYEQHLYIASDSDLLSEIEFHCNMEGAPTNFIDEDSQSMIMVIGPFDSSRLRYFTQNCRRI